MQNTFMCLVANEPRAVWSETELEDDSRWLVSREDGGECGWQCVVVPPRRCAEEVGVLVWAKDGSHRGAQV